jgi:fumarate reductase (CoM/CoB) subunit A
MEFVQFYPTAAGRHGRRLVLYEALVFHAGAILRNAHGQDILAQYGLKDPIAATRDRVSRAIMQEIGDGRGLDGGVVMDFGKEAQRLPAMARRLLPRTWTPEEPKLRVSPTAHFCMGGVVADPGMETALCGLFVAGEVCGGLHGANRLGGNALAEIFVMGALAGSNAADRARTMGIGSLRPVETQDEKDRLEALGHAGRFDAEALSIRLKELMWRHASILRNRQGLEKALEAIGQLQSQETAVAVTNPKDLRAAVEFQNMRRVAETVCRAALMRRESRGAHFRSDFPDEDDENWLASIVITKKNNPLSSGAGPPQPHATT